jgi:TRAP transporter TAXI family solute receptor
MARMASARSRLFTAGWLRPRWLVRAALGLTVAIPALHGVPLHAQSGAPAATQFFRIGSGVVDSPSFAVAGIVAAGLSRPPGAPSCERGGSCGVPGMIALAQAIGSSAEAIDLLEQRQIDAIVVPADDAYRAYAAKRPDGAKPREALRSVATLFVEGVHAVVREGTRYETVEDLKRHPVVGASDDPTATSFLRLYMSRLGLETGRKPAPVLSVTAGLRRLTDTRIDGLIMIAPPPPPALVEFARQTPVRLLPMPPAATARLPYLIDVKLAAGLYAGTEAVDLPALPIQLLVPASADATRVEAITRALWHDATQKLLAAGPPAARTVKLERALAGIVVPLHPGAARFYREAGLLANTPVAE